MSMPWFGPKRGFGWGWTPVSWQGWALTAVFLLCFLAAAYAPRLPHRAIVVVALLAGYFAAVIATGTRPGGSWR